MASLRVFAVRLLLVLAVLCVAESRILGRKAISKSGAGLFPARASPGQLKAAGSDWVTWAASLGAAAGGVAAERTRVGAALSAPLTTMLTTLALVNVGLIPTESAVYNAVNKRLVPLAVPLLLLNADLRRVIKDTGKLLGCFFVAALSTVVGTIAAFKLLPMPILGGEDGMKIAAALCARHIGGAVNYVAVADTLQLPPNLVSAGIAADNIVVAVYFTLLFVLAPSAPKASETPTAEVRVDDEVDGDAKSINILTSTTALAVAAATVAVGEALTKLMFGPATRVSALPVISVVSVCLATCFPRFCRGLSAAGVMAGTICMQLFFAATGAAGSLRMVAKTGPTVLFHSLLQVSIHFLTLRTLGSVFRLPMRELLLASNAAVGGPQTAASMAVAKKWDNLVLPSILTGILGYSCATLIALGIGTFVLKPMVL